VNFPFICWVIYFVSHVINYSYRFNDPVEPLEALVDNNMFGSCVIDRGGKNHNKPVLVIKVNHTDADGKVTLVDKRIKVIEVQQELVRYLLAMAVSQRKEAVELVLTTCPGMLGVHLNVWR
jgi:hypothetical protein